MKLNMGLHVTVVDQIVEKMIKKMSDEEIVLKNAKQKNKQKDDLHVSNMHWKKETSTAAFGNDP